MKKLIGLVLLVNVSANPQASESAVAKTKVSEQVLVRVQTVAGAQEVLQAGQSERRDQNTLVVYFENSLTRKEQFTAEKLADQMFATAGVRMVWRVGVPSAQEVAKERPIVVRFVFITPLSDHPGALAFALPYEGVHIKIFYDRVRARAPRITQMVVAHVLVHEITHMVESIDLHSDSGIMKAHWTAQDLSTMERQHLSFTQADIDLIQSGLAARQLAR